MGTSLAQIQTLHPLIRESALQAYSEAVRETPAGVHPIITQGYRTYSESDKLYALGRTVVNPDGKSAKKPMGNIVSNARGGQSWHNFALAIDFALVVNGKTIWDETHPSWKTVVDIFKSHGFDWGGDWKSFKDYPHFEKKMGLTLALAQQRYSKNDFISGNTYINLT